MANNCYFEMKIKGTKENCEKWYKKMTSYDGPNHFYRIFSAETYDEGGTDEDFYMYIAGDCAWSLEICCRTSGYSGEDLFEINSRDLSIVMEAYSSEPGCAFQEHYIYNCGECLEDECRDYKEYYYDRDYYESFEAFKEDYDLPATATEDDLDDGGYYHEGGFAKWVFTI